MRVENWLKGTRGGNKGKSQKAIVTNPGKPMFTWSGGSHGENEN